MTRDIEDILNAQPLEPPPESLDARIQSTLDNESRARLSASPIPTPDAGRPLRPILRSIFWLARGAALAAAIALLVHMSLRWGVNNNPTNQPPQTADEFVFDPVRIEHTWSAVEPQGLIMVDDQTPAAGFVERRVEHVQLIDEKNNVRMEFTVPRQDVIVIPVEYE